MRTSFLRYSLSDVYIRHVHIFRLYLFWSIHTASYIHYCKVRSIVIVHYQMVHCIERTNCVKAVNICINSKEQHAKSQTVLVKLGSLRDVFHIPCWMQHATDRQITELLKFILLLCSIVTANLTASNAIVFFGRLTCYRPSLFFAHIIPWLLTTINQPWRHCFELAYGEPKYMTIMHGFFESRLVTFIRGEPMLQCGSA